MIESSLNSWLILIAVVIVATYSGYTVSKLIPWTENARDAGVPVASGIAFAPFITGLASVFSLSFVPRADHSVHIALVAAILILISALRFSKAAQYSQNSTTTHGKTEVGTFILRCILTVWTLTLLLNSVFIPLTQNDSLEYATVGRLLFEARSLDAYPVLDSATNTSGFYGPWTHPPLYVSLIYLFSAIQGHVDEPGLMRLISPWFLLSATSCVFALGALRSKITGLFSAILLISTPMLFLGSDSSLIDALPTAGLALILTLLITTRIRGTRLGIWLGIALGLALWTHSQAILFIPLLASTLLIFRGLKQWKLAGIEFATALAVAMVIAIWPYWNNMILFGSPVSDNPAVFALAELDWKGYFQFARGIDTWQAAIQYGILKGWFTISIYGLLYWFMLIGLAIFLIKEVKNRFISTITHGADQYSDGDILVWTVTALFLTYLAGMVMSVLLGIDIMIKNDRYILVITPAVAIIAAYGLNHVGHLGARFIANGTEAAAWRKDIVIIMFLLLVIILLLHYLVFGLYHRWRSTLPDGSIPPTTATSRFDRILSYWPSVKIMRDMGSIVPKDAKVLSFRPANMYYSDRRMVSYLDPVLLPVYKEKSAEKAAKMLKEMGIHFIHTTDYCIPPLYNSSLMHLLGMPRLSKLEYSSGMNQIYSLKDSNLEPGSRINFSPGKAAWSRSLIMPFGIQAHSDEKSEAFRTTGRSIADYSLFHRYYSTSVTHGNSSYSKEGQASLNVEPGFEYILKAVISGRGFVRAWITEFDANGIAIMQYRRKSIRIGELALTEKFPRQTLVKRFTPHPSARRIGINIEHLGKSNLKIEHAEFIKLEKRN